MAAALAVLGVRRSLGRGLAAAGLLAALGLGAAVARPQPACPSPPAAAQVADPVAAMAAELSCTSALADYATARLAVAMDLARGEATVDDDHHRLALARAHVALDACVQR